MINKFNTTSKYYADFYKIMAAQDDILVLKNLGIKETEIYKRNKRKIKKTIDQRL